MTSFFRERPALLNRRSLLASLGAAGVASAVPSRLLAAPPTDYRLRMTNQNTGERFDEIVIADNQWVEESVDEFSRFARDWRRNEVRNIHKNVILSALKIQTLMETTVPTVLLSGYRSPQTNKTIRGAATNSLHIKGYALDIRQPDRSVRQLHRAAVSLKAGGVGYYPASEFVHIDAGNVRQWNG
jgi:uncharacterized protein YcbK (DUF882 family)